MRVEVRTAGMRQLNRGDDPMLAEGRPINEKGVTGT